MFKTLTRNVLLVAMLIAAVVTARANWDTSRVLAVVAGLLVAVVGGGFVWWSYRRGPHIELAMAHAATAQSGGYVLWKPGCPYCERLIRAMKHDARVHWVNVWQDPAANAEVRLHNNGNELTPTAVVGDQILINPSAAQLQAALDARR